MKRLLLLAAAALAGCSVSLDPGSVPCRNDGECPTGAFCAASGKCAPQPACSGGTSSCHGACVNLSTSAANCGTCGNSCTAPAGATATCSSGSCGFTCTPPAVQQGTGCLTPPAMPTDLTATATSSVTLDWAAQADAISYEVFKATDAGGPFDSIASPTTNTYEDQAVSPGTTYFYEIKAHNLAGASAATSPVSVLTQPATPTNFGASLITGNSAVALTWDRMPGAASYDVYRGRSSGSQALYQNVADPGSGSTVRYD
ncbi:MAG TPA: hypothetical protein VLW85_21745, partial [Myxococcales bacterium]|nr:hypothetical protein [Myxococcales bacterium]